MVDSFFFWLIFGPSIPGAANPGGGANPGGAPTCYLANFTRKLHENEVILGRGRPLRPLDPPMHSCFIAISELEFTQIKIK